VREEPEGLEEASSSSGGAATVDRDEGAPSLEDNGGAPAANHSALAVFLQAIAKGEAGDKHLELPSPATWQEAFEGAQAQDWFEAMVRELHGLRETKTFAVARDAPKNVVKSKWVLKVK